MPSGNTAVLLTRLLSELSTYLDYKFHCKPNRDTLDNIKGRLVSLKDSYVDLSSYNRTCQMVAGPPAFTHLQRGILCGDR